MASFKVRGINAGAQCLGPGPDPSCPLPLAVASFPQVLMMWPPPQELSLSRPLPNTNPRQHANSISLGAVNSNHRITRRKSVTTAVANAAAAVAASLKEGGEPASLPMGAAHRRSLGPRKGLESTSVGGASGFSSYLSRSMNSPSQEPPVARKPSPSNSDQDGKSVPKGHNRRASEGAHMKTDGKRAPADLRCDRCGKGYKHGSCLSKHMCVSPMSPGSLLLRSGVCATSALCRSPSWSLISLPSLLPYSPPPATLPSLPFSPPSISLVASG